MGIDEPSLEEDPVAVEPEVDYSDIRYEVVPKATQRGRPQLFDSAGYCYGIHRQTTARLHRVWDRLRSNERSVRQTLHTCCQPRCGYVRTLCHIVTCILISPYSYKG